MARSLDRAVLYSPRRLGQVRRPPELEPLSVSQLSLRAHLPQTFMPSGISWAVPVIPLARHPQRGKWFMPPSSRCPMWHTKNFPKLRRWVVL